jgi:hypothetical protein
MIHQPNLFLQNDSSTQFIFMKYILAILFLGECTLSFAQKTCPLVSPQLNWVGDNALLQWEVSPGINKGTLQLFRTMQQQKTLVKDWNVSQDRRAYEHTDAVSILQKDQYKYSLEYWNEKQEKVCQVTLKSKNAGDGSDVSVSPPQEWASFKQNLQYKIEMHGQTHKTVWLKPVLQNTQHIPNDENRFYFRFGNELYRMLPLSDMNELIRLKIPLQNKPTNIHKYQVVLVQGDEIVGISDEIAVF